MGTSASSRATLPVGPRGIDAARLAGERFRVKRHIGAGGSKEVFQAEDLTLRRDVALAFIPGVGLRGSTRERVLHEVQTTARLEHPHIVTVYDVREAPDATIIVSRLDPRRLGRRLARAHRPRAGAGADRRADSAPGGERAGPRARRRRHPP